jgi:hypothetical protein
MRKKPERYNWPLTCALICAVLLCVAFGFLGDAQATSGVVSAPSSQPTPDTLYQGDLFCPYNYDGVFGRVVHCIQALVVEAAKTFLNGFMPVYTSIVIAAMVLAVTIYGAMIAMGTVTRPPVQSIILMLKVGAVAFFTLQFSGLIDMVFDVMEGLLYIVTDYMTLSASSACSDEGKVRELFVDFERAEISAWDKVDCMFMTLLGVGVASTAASGFVSILVALLFMGGIGLILAVIGMLFILTLLFSLLRAVKIYLMSVISVAFLICVSPLIIPMVLFAPTKPLFNQWLKNLLNYMVIPVFLFAYLAMMVAAFDALVFKGRYSLFYAVASEASQEEGFNFKDWLEFGVSGQVARDEKNKPLYDASNTHPVIEKGITTDAVYVGKGVPDLLAVGIIQHKLACESATEEEQEALGNCDIENLNTMIDCALNPLVPRPGESPESSGEGSCAIADGRPYYGFQRNEEVFNFALAVNIDSDKVEREKRNQGCSFGLLCAVGDFVGKVAGFAFDVAKNVVGAVFQVVGAIWQVTGEVLKAIGSFIGGVCRNNTPAPGLLCDMVGGPFLVVGSVVNTAGDVVNFSGRLMMHGLEALLKDFVDGWFDVLIMDLQKITSYHCKVKNNLPDLTSHTQTALIEDYLACPGPEVIIIEILYVLITALVVTYLMMRWLNYIPSLGSMLISSSAPLSADLPLEGAVSKATGGLQHRMDEILSKKKRGGAQ